jgi:mannose-6-phosphate isomerase-like protein (cupin superfamily)
MGRHIVSGVGEDGRSAIVSTQEKASFAATDFSDLTDDSEIQIGDKQARKSIANLFAADRIDSLQRQSTGHLLPIPTPPGGALWLEMKFDGYYETEFHRTDSIDFHYMVDGKVELILENGSVTLEKGDTVLIPGVVHRWRTDTSWHSSLLVIGVPPSGKGAAGTQSA